MTAPTDESVVVRQRSADLRHRPPPDTSFHDFVEHPVMKEIKERSIFIHVDLPGQEDDAANLPEE